MKVPFVDLKAQYADIQEDIERDVLDVLRSWWVVGGPYVKKFEDELGEFLNGQHVVGVSSGTDALQLALEALRETRYSIGKRKYIIVPVNTFIASAFAIMRAGFTPLWVPPDNDSYLMNYNAVRDALLKYPDEVAGIMCVHLYGQMCDMDALQNLAWAHDVWLVEDAAQAIGAMQGLDRPGQRSDIACTSFYPAKNLGTCGQGGAIATTHRELADIVRAKANQGGLVKYEHEYLGGNYRLDSIMAAQLRHALRKLTEWDDGRRYIASLYNEAFGDRAQRVYNNNLHCYHLYEYKCDDLPHRRDLMARLEANDIACGLHYPEVLQNQRMFSYEPYVGNIFGDDRILHNRLLSLPIFPTMTAEQAKYVIEVVNS